MATIPLVDYLFLRLKQLGLETLHGVPGDYNLSVLAHVENLDLRWAGNSNELNAAYAADGYARVKGIGAVLTTSGVGELSAINAIAGAYAERSPVVHITGTPPTVAQLAGTSLHHTMGDGDFRRFARIAEHVVVAQVNLGSCDDPAREVDHVLGLCKLHSRPVYIELPTDRVRTKVPRARLDKAIPSPNLIDQNSMEDAISTILERIYTARQPMIMLDGFVTRYDAQKEAQDFVRALGIPTCSTSFGRSIITEELTNYYGVYSGPTGDQDLDSWVRECDLVVVLGPLFSDTNTFAFTTVPDPKLSILLHRASVEIGSDDGLGLIDGTPLKPLLESLVNRLDPTQLHNTNGASGLLKPSDRLSSIEAPRGSDSLKQHHLWELLSSYLVPGDIVLADTGTSSVGTSTMKQPLGCRYIFSPIWLSIGFALPAAAGASAAERDLASEQQRQHSRTILFQGDGSFQMTAQSVSDIIRARLDVIIVILNNNGYTVERWIDGMNAHYNDIPNWQYLRTAEYFGAPVCEDTYPVVTQRASTWQELSAVLKAPQFVRGRGLTIVELVLEQSDAPLSLQLMARSAGERFCS